MSITDARDWYAVYEHTAQGGGKQEQSVPVACWTAENYVGMVPAPHGVLTSAEVLPGFLRYEFNPGLTRQLTEDTMPDGQPTVNAPEVLNQAIAAALSLDERLQYLQDAIKGDNRVPSQSPDWPWRHRAGLKIILSQLHEIRYGITGEPLPKEYDMIAALLMDKTEVTQPTVNAPTKLIVVIDEGILDAVYSTNPNVKVEHTIIRDMDDCLGDLQENYGDIFDEDGYIDFPKLPDKYYQVG